MGKQHPRIFRCWNRKLNFLPVTSLHDPSVGSTIHVAIADKKGPHKAIQIYIAPVSQYVT